MSTAGPGADFGRSFCSSSSLGDSARTFFVEANVKNAAGVLLASNGLNSTLRTRRCFALAPPRHMPQEVAAGGKEEMWGKRKVKRAMTFVTVQGGKER